MGIAYETRITRVIVLQADDGLCSEEATTIEIDDEGAGEFVRLSQRTTISIEPGAWPTLREAINMMVQQCRAETSQSDRGQSA